MRKNFELSMEVSPIKLAYYEYFGLRWVISPFALKSTQFGLVGPLGWPITTSGARFVLEHTNLGWGPYIITIVIYIAIYYVLVRN